MKDGAMNLGQQRPTRSAQPGQSQLEANQQGSMSRADRPMTTAKTLMSYTIQMRTYSATSVATTPKLTGGRGE